MPAELFRNILATPITLTATYTAGGTTLTVSSAAQFDVTPGRYRVAIGNAAKTVFRVDSVSGSVLTGIAVANDGNAAIGDTVISVSDREIGERFLQAPETGGFHAPTGVNGLAFLGPVWPVRPIVDAEFSWVNQGSATHANVGGIARLTVPTQTQNIRARMKAFPSSNFTVSALLIPFVRTVASAECGLIFREAATDKWQAINQVSDGAIRVTNWTAANTIDSNQATEALGPANFVGSQTWHLWFRLAYNGTNVSFSYSYDGAHWVELLSEAKTARFTTAPDQVGYFVNDRSSSVTQAMSLLSWVES